MTEKEYFLSICNTNIHRPGIIDLLSYLEKTDFYIAPASTKHHLACEGGLLKHSLNVYDRFLTMGVEAETAAICALFHDLCKSNYYKTDYRNAKNEQGVWEKVPYYAVDDKLPYGHGEKSVYIISGFMKITREEAMAIRWHMGGFDDSVKGGSYSMSAAFEQCPIACKLHIADMQATYLDEKRESING